MELNLQRMSELRNLFFSLRPGQRATLKSLAESRSVDPGNRFAESLIDLGLVERSENELIATKAGKYVARLF